MNDFELTVGQVALLLGMPRVCVIDWIHSGALAFSQYNKTITVKKSAIADFLGQRRELVGRLYCEDITPVITQWRQEIIEEMDKRWPLEPIK